jgi:hypothetical protein
LNIPDFAFAPSVEVTPILYSIITAKCFTIEMHHLHPKTIDKVDAGLMNLIFRQVLHKD